MKPDQRKSKRFFSWQDGVSTGLSIALWYLFRDALGYPSLFKETSGQLAISFISFVVIYIVVKVASELFAARRKN